MLLKNSIFFLQELGSEKNKSGNQGKSTCSTDLVSPLIEEFNFSTSVFGQLTNDLQKILGMGVDQSKKGRREGGGKIELFVLLIYQHVSL